MNRKICWLCGYILLMLVLSGCAKSTAIQGDMRMIVHLDGSGQYQLTVQTHPIFLPNLNFLKQRLETAQFKIKTFETKSTAGWTATKDVANISQEPLPLAQPAITGKNKQWKQTIDIDRGLFFHTINIHYDLDLTHVDQETPIKEYARLFYDRIKLRLLLVLPIQPSKHNAAAVTDHGKTLVWNLHLGQHNRLHLNATVPNPIGWIVSCLSVLVLVAVASFLLWRNVKRTNKQQ